MKAALLVGAIVIGGVGAGAVVERAGLVSPLSETTYIAALDEVPYFDCPDVAPLGDLHRGDRVFVTGRTADGEWVEIRAPYDTESGVWVRMGWLIPDSPIVSAAVAIPVCLGDDEPADGPDTSNTSIAPLPDDEPTSSSNSSSSSSSSSTSTTTSTTSTATTTTSTTSTTTSSTSATTTSTTTTTTLPADQQGPVVNFFPSTESELSEAIGECFKPLTAAVRAVVSDPSGISSVQLSWSVGTSNGTVDMPWFAELGIYSVTIGPFSGSTLSGGNAPIALTLTARDAFSNATSQSSSSLIQLFDCGG